MWCVLRQDPPYRGECRDLSRKLPRKQSVTSLQIVVRYLVDGRDDSGSLRQKLSDLIDRAWGLGEVVDAEYVTYYRRPDTIQSAAVMELRERGGVRREVPTPGSPKTPVSPVFLRRGGSWCGMSPSRQADQLVSTDPLLPGTGDIGVFGVDLVLDFPGRDIRRVYLGYSRHTGITSSYATFTRSIYTQEFVPASLRRGCTVADESGEGDTPSPLFPQISTHGEGAAIPSPNRCNPATPLRNGLRRDP
jgi:hypothetical protein